MLVAGDFGGLRGGRPYEKAAVSAENYKEVFARFRPELLKEVPNRLGQRPKTLVVRLPLQRLKDFQPAAIVKGVPALKRVSDLIRNIEAFKSGDLLKGDFSAALSIPLEGLEFLAEPLALCHQAVAGGAPSAPSGSPAVSGPAAVEPPSSSRAKKQQEQEPESSLDRILEMVDTAPAPQEQEAQAAKTTVGSLINAVVGAGKSGTSKAGDGAASSLLDRALSRCRDLLSAQVDVILHDPRFQELEAAWRGLWFLVKRADFRKGVRLEILDTSREDLLSAMDEGVFQPELEGRCEEDLSLVLVHFPIRNISVDLQLLQTLGEQAEELQVPLVAAVEAEFFDLGSRAEAARLHYPARVLEGAQYTKWNALRQKECSRWIAVAFNHFLLRSPYTAGDRGSLGLQESALTEAHLLWGNPIWALASLVARSFARTDWPTAITGASDGEVEDLCIHGLASEPSRPMQIPLGAFLSEDLARDLAAVGLIPLSSAPGGDAAYVFRVPMLHRPPQFSDERSTDAGRVMCSLSYQLLASRLAQMVLANKAACTGDDRSAQEIQDALQSFLLGILADTGPGAGAAVQIRRLKDGRRMADLTLRTGREVLQGVEVNFSVMV